MKDYTLGLLRKNILNLPAYVSARSETKESNQETIYLDANENPWPPEVKDFSFVNYKGDKANYNRYPEPQPVFLLNKLAQIYQVSTENIMIGRGVDDAIDILVRSFCEPSIDEIMICPPTYGVYELYAQIHGVKVKKAFLDDNFDIDFTQIDNKITDNTKLIFLCSPNNPTGNLLSTEKIFQLLDKYHKQALVIVDEAYIEFADNNSNTSSMIAYLKKYPNLVILRTLSKAWGLAGARCGVAIANDTIIPYLQKVRAPYPLSQPAIDVVQKVLESDAQSKVKEKVQLINKTKEILISELRKFEFIDFIYPSDANFILIKSSVASQLINFCNENRIILRNRSGEGGLEDCIRISIGSEEEIFQLLRVLADFNSKLKTLGSQYAIKE